MFYFWRGATAALVPGFLCQSGCRRPENVSILSSLMARSSVPISPQAFVRHLSGICHLVRPRDWNLSENLCPGVGHLAILLEAVNVVPFSIFHQKICLLDISIWIIFLIHALWKDMCSFRSTTSLPHSTFCTRLRNCFPPSWSARSWKKNNQCLVWRVKREKSTFFVRQWLRMKGLEKFFEIFES